MKLFLLSIFCLWGLSFSSKSSTKIKKLDELFRKNPYEAIQLDSDTYDEFTTGPRNYSIYVVHTALTPQHNCKPCKVFHEEFKLVGQAWGRQFSSGNVYIAILDYVNGQSVFHKLKLNTVPYLVHFPPNKGDANRKEDRYDFDRNGLDADSVARFIESTSQLKLAVKRPINYTLYAVGAAALFLGLVFLRYVQKYLALVYENKKLWIISSVGTIVLMCSGHMWNHIRMPPYTGFRDGKPELFAPGFSSQYVGETQVIGVLYALTAIIFVGLTVKVPTIEDKTFQRTVCFILLLAFLFFYSVLLVIFRLKNGGYPFKLLF